MDLTDSVDLADSIGECIKQTSEMLKIPEETIANILAKKYIKNVYLVDIKDEGGVSKEQYFVNYRESLVIGSHRYATYTDVRNAKKLIVNTISLNRKDYEQDINSFKIDWERQQREFEEYPDRKIPANNSEFEFEGCPYLSTDGEEMVKSYEEYRIRLDEIVEDILKIAKTKFEAGDNSFLYDFGDWDVTIIKLILE